MKKLAFVAQAERALMTSTEFRVNLEANCSPRLASCVLSLFMVFIGFIPEGHAQNQTTAKGDLSQLVRNQIAPVSDYEIGKTTFQDVLDSGWRINPADGVIISISKIEYTSSGFGAMVLGLHPGYTDSTDLADRAAMDRFFRAAYEEHPKPSFHFDLKTMRSREDTRVIDLSLCTLSFENWTLTAKECSDKTGVVSASAGKSSSDENNVATNTGTQVLANYQDASDAYKRGDYSTALKVLKPLAEAGDARAQFSLGRMYQDGYGSIQDDRKYEVAIRWYRLAAQQEHGGALNSLGYVYRNGKGVTQDFIQAHMWWDIAASHRASHAAQNLYDLRKIMTPADISTAESLARECVAKEYKDCSPNLAIVSGDSAVGDSTSKPVPAHVPESVLLLEGEMSGQIGGKAGLYRTGRVGAMTSTSLQIGSQSEGGVTKTSTYVLSESTALCDSAGAAISSDGFDVGELVTVATYGERPDHAVTVHKGGIQLNLSLVAGPVCNPGL